MNTDSIIAVFVRLETAAWALKQAAAEMETLLPPGVALLADIERARFHTAEAMVKCQTAVPALSLIRWDGK